MPSYHSKIKISLSDEYSSTQRGASAENAMK